MKHEDTDSTAWQPGLRRRQQQKLLGDKRSPWCYRRRSFERYRHHLVPRSRRPRHSICLCNGRPRWQCVPGWQR